jgi:hypothetical protein
MLLRYLLRHHPSAAVRVDRAGGVYKPLQAQALAAGWSFLSRQAQCVSLGPPMEDGP